MEWEPTGLFKYLAFVWKHDLDSQFIRFQPGILILDVAIGRKEKQIQIFKLTSLKIFTIPQKCIGLKWFS